ncbi:uncharacterized protein B0I36DRAFT_3681 [Microdochium trichocladiopsis]|uniref:Uncharacterized protein n=1 Tax=Microdochium trichocladiopsis TaxID=1682393 RepID=A0A9P9BVP0_9PEZI|nr:uncharacterized protein B0I36DRAFT_3681 [Microdochium trichocladiopsis]KAH7039942.1 hypothetical protein B0I36DRAFT_3681 [Microdochium trichocladiopsis]
MRGQQSTQSSLGAALLPPSSVISLCSAVSSGPISRDPCRCRSETLNGAHSFTFTLALSPSQLCSTAWLLSVAVPSVLFAALYFYSPISSPSTSPSSQQVVISSSSLSFVQQHKHQHHVVSATRLPSPGLRAAGLPAPARLLSGPSSPAAGTRSRTLRLHFYW